MTLYIRGVA